MNLFGYTYKIYDIGYKTEMTSKECNSGDPLETPGGLYRGPPSNENTIFKKTKNYKVIITIMNSCTVPCCSTYAKTIK